MTPFCDDVRDRGEPPAPEGRSFLAFVDAIAERLEKGREVYGDRSFDRPSVELVDEIAEELLDVCAWSFILWCRLQQIRKVLAFAESGDAARTA